MPESEQPFNPVIVDPSGRPARKARDRNCPMCGAGPEHRTGTGGFGGPQHPVCTGGCSPAYEWKGEVFRESQR